VTITDVALPTGVAPRSGFVRIVSSRQQWTLQPTADGSILVDMRTLSDPAGPIPASIINAMTVNMPFKTLRNLREMVKRPQYAQAQLPFIDEVAGSSP
jgi:hypothetical protein